MKDEVTVIELYELLLEKARKTFPSVITTSNITSVGDSVVCTITHHNVINNMYDWRVIIYLTSMLKTSDGRVGFKVDSKDHALGEYNHLVHQAESFELFKIPEVAVASE